MTTGDSAITRVEQPEGFIVFPDPPEIPEDKMTNFDHLAVNGNVHHLAIHFANPGYDRAALSRPDHPRRRAYIIADQGKLPDFVMEVTSTSSRRIDATAQRNDYAALGIP